MHSEAIENRVALGEWQTEAVNHDGDGEVYVTIFSGPDAETRAKEYCFQAIGDSYLHPGSQRFFIDQSIEDLARIQGVSPIEDIGILSGGIPEDEDVAEFLREIYAARK